MQTFDPNATDALSRAFDAAWSRILHQHGGTSADTTLLRELLAKQMVRLATAGETDERRLASAAILQFCTQSSDCGSPAERYASTCLS
jgi:hypothetical protein